MPAVARPHLERLVGQTGETATLSARQGWSRVYVDQVLSPQEVRMSVTLGRPYPLHAGSSSKAILAALPDQEIDEYLRHHDLEPITGATLTTAEGLREQIGRIRDLGYAVSAGERQAGAGSVAAPVFRAGAPRPDHLCRKPPDSDRPPVRWTGPHGRTLTGGTPGGGPATGRLLR